MLKSNKISSEERRALMLESKPSRLIVQMALPTIIAMAVDSIYNLADTFFVSSIGETATAAVAVNDSFMHILIAVSGGFAFGLASYVSRLLGAKEDEHANSVASATTLVSIIAAIAVIFFIWPIRAQVVELFGSTDEALKYSVDYSTYILLAFPFTMLNSILNQLLKSEGNTTYAMIGTVSGCVLNCILDPIFINTFEWEVAGAAAATALSKVVSFFVLAYPYFKKTPIIKLSLKHVAFSWRDFVEVLKTGIPVFLRMALMSFGSILTNRAAKTFGTATLAGISIANKLYRFVSSIIMGFGQGFAPCAGYCWGAKKYKRTKDLYYVTCKIGCISGIILGVIVFFAASPLISIFNGSGNPAVLSIGMFKLRLLCIGLVPHIFTMITNNLYQALGKPVGNTILGLSRQVLFLVPLILILPNYFQEYGVAAAQGMSDILAGILLAIPFAVYLIRQINRMEDEFETELQTE